MTDQIRRVSSGILLAFFLALAVSQTGSFRDSFSAVSAASLAESTAGTTEALLQPELPLPVFPHSARSVLVIETSRQRTLYAANLSPQMHIPAASKIMTALIASERLSPDVQVTISKVAADAAELEDSPDGVLLRSGDKYPLGYLLTRLIYYDSDAAALAIAEQIANVEEKFVEIMNSRAASIGMSGTVFKNSTGNMVIDDPIADWKQPGDELPLVQYTTMTDLALLMVQATSNPVFRDVLTQPSRFFVFDDSTLVSMRNEMAAILTRSEGIISGVFYSEEAGMSYSAAIGSVNGINLIAITANGIPASTANDLLTVFQGCASFYVLSPLVVSGDLFTGAHEQTVDGEVFGLVFKNTVYYVHPRNHDFLMPSIRYNTFGPFSRPIMRNMIVGQVIFELLDGTQIAVDVSPDRQILSSISIIDRALGELQQNNNLALVLMLAGALLVTIMLIHVLMGLNRLFRLALLIIFERRSRRF